MLGETRTVADSKASVAKTELRVRGVSATYCRATVLNPERGALSQLDLRLSGQLMCNLYSIRKSREEVIGLFGISHVDDGVQLDLPAVYPDSLAPVVTLDENGARTLATMRWGFPPPPNGGPRPVTNIRNTKSPYWRNCIT